MWAHAETCLTYIWHLWVPSPCCSLLLLPADTSLHDCPLFHFLPSEVSVRHSCWLPKNLSFTHVHGDPALVFISSLVACSINKNKFQCLKVSLTYPSVSQHKWVVVLGLVDIDGTSITTTTEGRTTQRQRMAAFSLSKKICVLPVSGVNNRNPGLIETLSMQGVRFTVEEPFYLAKRNTPFSLTLYFPFDREVNILLTYSPQSHRC